MDITFKSGDVGLSSSRGWTAKVIRFFTSWHTTSATRSHAFAFVSGRVVVEALGRMSANPAEKYVSGDEDVVVYRLPLTAPDRVMFELEMIRQVRRGYGWGKLPLFALDAISTKVKSLFGSTRPVFFFTRRFGVTNFPVCSQFVVWGLHKHTGYRIKDYDGRVVEWKTVSPDYLEDLLKLSHNEAEVIYKSGGKDE